VQSGGGKKKSRTSNAAPGSASALPGKFDPNEQNIQRAMEFHNAGDLSSAENIYNQVLQTEPNHPIALHLLGVIAYQVGKHEIAVELIGKAVTVQPNYAVAHCNLGNALGQLGKWNEAIACYQRALSLESNNIEAHYNMGNAHQELGELDAAIMCYQTVLRINPRLAEAHNNLGAALQDQGRFDESIPCFEQALSNNPNFVDAYNNLGNVYRGKNDLDEAARCYNAAISIHPDYFIALNNLGIVLGAQGKFDEAISNYHKSINANPDYAEAWNNFGLAVKVYLFLNGHSNEAQLYCDNGLSSAAQASRHFMMYQYYLKTFKPHEADEVYSQAMMALPPKQDEEVAVDQTPDKRETSSQVPDKLVALLHFGRSGTGLFHSLIDNHPEISTLPSVYLRGYFNAGVWDRLISAGWREIPRRFTHEFAVLFDAKSEKPVPDSTSKSIPCLGINEGMANVGEERNEALSIDKEQFCVEALELMKNVDRMDPCSFLMIAHAACEKVLKSGKQKELVFYHIHNPNDFAKLNFVRYVPQSRLIVMIREPVESCESWVRTPLAENDYSSVVFRFIAMLFGIDQVIYRGQETVGVRLEDLKKHPKNTLRSIANWLGVEVSSSLYEMTAQGKKWWGDPSSPLYHDTKAMEPFGDTTDTTATIPVFTERDRLVLRTLFYPFSVRFGCEKPDPEKFSYNLDNILPQLDDMMDFEIELSQNLGISNSNFQRCADYVLLRAAIRDRWQVLKEHQDYPHMLIPLDIN
jgi:tetratricopeptide (TPR) repeat protein